MKKTAVLLALFGAGFLVSSFALADDGGRGEHKSTSTAKTTTIKTTTRTTTTTTTTPRKKCKGVSLKGTAGATSFTITVDKSNHSARSLKGKAVTLTFSGKVSVSAKMCSSGSTSSASSFELRNLHVRSGDDEDDDD